MNMIPAGSRSRSKKGNGRQPVPVYGLDFEKEPDHMDAVTCQRQHDKNGQKYRYAVLENFEKSEKCLYKHFIKTPVVLYFCFW